MTRSLTRCQFVAFGAGVVLSAALYGLAMLLHPQVGLPPLLGLFLGLGFGLGIPVVFALLVARYAGRCERVAYITTLLPGLVMVIGAFGVERDMHIRAAARHAMDHTLSSGWFFPGLLLLGWSCVTAAMGIALKRRINGEAPLGRAEPVVQKGGSLAFPIFLGLLAIATMAGGVLHFADTWKKNSPAGRVATARKVLDSPVSTMDQRAKVLFDIHLLIDNEDSRVVLRKALKDQPAPLNLLAAGALAERDDVSSLSLLEPSLMKSGQWEHSWPGFRGKMNLGHDLERFTDPAAVPALAHLMKSEDPEVRRGAAQSLRHMQDDVAIDAMIGGLEDSNWEVRWISVMGFAEAMDKDPGETKSWYPAYDTFKKSEPEYLAHWRSRGAAWRASR